MEGTEHTIGLGKIIGNLHSLELLLRVFLCEKNRENLDFPEIINGGSAGNPSNKFHELG